MSMPSVKQFTLYYKDVLPHSPAMIKIEEFGGDSAPVFFLREPMKIEGDAANSDLQRPRANMRLWSDSKNGETDVEKIRSEYGLTNEFILLTDNQVYTAEDSYPKEMGILNGMIADMNMPMYIGCYNIAARTISVDFWGRNIGAAGRPHARSTVESMTFEDLKQMWRAVGKSGFSSKSKADLFEGFAEHAIETASSEGVETFLKTLPGRMLVVPDMSHHDGLETLEDNDEILGVLSRISGSALFAVDHTPDIDEQGVGAGVVCVDLKDPYECDYPDLQYEGDAAALEALKQLYIQGDSKG